MRPLLIFVVVFIAVDLGASEFWEPQLLGTFQLKDAGFVEVFQTHPQATNYTDRYTLYLTTFNFGKKKYFIALAIFFENSVEISCRACEESADARARASRLIKLLCFFSCSVHSRSGLPHQITWQIFGFCLNMGHEIGKIGREKHRLLA